MIQLASGYAFSEIKVHPKNWLTNKNAINVPWYIYYRFYEPSPKGKVTPTKGKLIIIKGMNHLKTREERITITKKMLTIELEKLRNGSFNPNIGEKARLIPSVDSIEPNTPFLTALESAEKRIHGAPSTKRDLKNILTWVNRAADELQLSQLPICSISRKHIKQVLLQIEDTLGESAHRFNKIRSYLMMIFAELMETDSVEQNPLFHISKRKTTLKLRKLISPENRVQIDNHLKEHHHGFWIFLHVFFHSGVRLTEIMDVQKKHVDLKQQSFIVTVKKGKHSKEMQKPIKNVALSFWEEVLIGAQPDDFVFSKDLLPGPTKIQSYQITKRWNRHVKKKLGIEEDFYSLKHLNLDQISDILGLSDAAAMASHSSTLITEKHYAVNEARRQAARLKAVENLFAP